MAQQVIGQDASDHCFSDWRGANADAGIVAALGAELDLLAEAVDAAHRRQNRTGRFHGQAADDVLSGRDAGQDAAGMVAEEGGLAILHAHLVGILLAAHGRRCEAVADLHALHGVDAHQRLGEVGIELVVDRIAEADRDAGRHDLDYRAARAAALADVIEIAFPALRGLAVGAPEGIVAGGVPVPLGTVDLLCAELDHRAANPDAIAQHLAGDRAGGHAHGRLARRLAAAAAIVAHAILLQIGVVAVRGPELVLDLAVVAAALVDVVDVQRDRRAGRDALEDAGQDFYRVRLLALRHKGRLTGTALVHTDLDFGLGDGNAWRC